MVRLHMSAVTWIFSGIGVLPLALAFECWRRRRARIKAATEPTTVGSAGSALVLHKTTTASVNDWIGVTARIRKGDYYDIGQSTFGDPLRVEVADIRMASIPERHRDKPTDQLAVELNVMVGGGIVYPGERTVGLGVNRYLIPRLESDESAESVYAFHIRDDYFSALCVSVIHINSHDACADIRFSRISVAARR